MRKNLNELSTLNGTFLLVLLLGFTLVNAYLNRSSFAKEPVVFRPPKRRRKQPTQPQTRHVACYCLPYLANQAPTEDALLKDEELQVMYFNSTILEVPCYGGWVMTACNDCMCMGHNCADVFFMYPDTWICFTSKQRCQVSWEIGSGKDMYW